YALEALGGRWRAVSDDDLAGMQRIPDPHTAAVMERDPRCAGGRIEQCIEDRPIRDRIEAVPHPLRLAKWRCDRPRVEMVSADDDRSRQLAPSHQRVQRAAEPGTLPLPQPANAGRESLERDALLRHRDPTSEVRVVWE